EELQVQMICFNFETVQVTWNASQYPGTNLTFFYKFSPEEEYSPCPRYTVDQGHATGCLLGAKDAILYFSIRDGSRPVLTMDQWVSEYLKPSSPEDVRFSWHQEAVTVVCTNLSYNGLLYEVQYRSTFDTAWQSKEEKSCHVTVDGLDAEKCYSFRARIKASEVSYGSATHPSDWSETALWQGGQPRDRCPEKEPLSPRFILLSGLATVLALSLLSLSVWKLWRMKRLLVPTVPDPKSTFPGLFEQHRGDFQEWIRDTQNVAPVSKMEFQDQECEPVGALVVQPAKTEVGTPTTVGEGEASGGPLPLPGQLPRGGDVVSVGGFTFVVSDSSYVTL
ncbi:Cytokine receptor-like factor 2, partial [Tupaia chinensis]